MYVCMYVCIGRWVDGSIDVHIDGGMKKGFDMQYDFFKALHIHLHRLLVQRQNNYIGTEGLSITGW